MRLQSLTEVLKSTRKSSLEGIPETSPIIETVSDRLDIAKTKISGSVSFKNKFGQWWKRQQSKWLGDFPKRKKSEEKVTRPAPLKGVSDIATSKSAEHFGKVRDALIEPKKIQGSNYTQALTDLDALDPVFRNLYDASYEKVAPLIIGATDRVLKKAAKTEEPKVLFIARDGIGGYEVAKQLLQKFPQRYDGLTADSLHYVYVNYNTIRSSLIKEYLKQECNLSPKSSVFPTDLGWYGSLGTEFSALFKGDMGHFQGLHLTLSPNNDKYVRPYVDLNMDVEPFTHMSGNPAVHFMEDTFSGLKGRPKKFKMEDSGKIVPDLPTANYSEEVKAKRLWGLRALSDAGADITLSELNKLTPEEVNQILSDFLKEPKQYQKLMVPHESH